MVTSRTQGPRVSIGLPVYNGERYLSAALDSLLKQTFDDFELIICDNASTDKTETLCRSYAQRDRRIRYRRNAVNHGAAKNYRLAFEHSSGEYFRWAAYDDLVAPDLLARCVEVLDREPSVVLAYPKTRLLDQWGRVISDYEDGLHLQSSKASERFVQLLRSLRLCNAVYGLIRAPVLRRTALLGSYIGSDGPLLAELTLYGKFFEIPDSLFYRRQHPAAFSSQKTTTQLLRFYEPQSRRQTSLSAWRHLLAHLAAIRRAPLSIAEKTRIYRFLVRNTISSRGVYAGELATLVRGILHQQRPAQVAALTARRSSDKSEH